MGLQKSLKRAFFAQTLAQTQILCKIQQPPPRQRTKRPAEAIIFISDTRLKKGEEKFGTILVCSFQQMFGCYAGLLQPKDVTIQRRSLNVYYLAKSGHSWETASGYMSRVWTKIQEDFHSVPLTTGNLAWYTRVRKVTQDLVSELNAAHGIQSGSTPSLNEGDLEVISTVLYRHEQYDGRLKVILSKQCGGRITEICKLRSTDF